MTDLSTLPQRFVENVCGAFGEAGLVLLRELPRLVDESCRHWGLELSEHFDNISYNFVAPGRLPDGTEIVLKIGVPTSPELLCEIETLRIYDGRRMVRLLDAIPERGVLLIERLMPGQALTLVQDDEAATRLAARLMKDMWRPVTNEHSFPTVARWFDGLRRLRQRFGGTSGPLSSGLFSLAEEISAQLLTSSTAQVLLHGDLHQDNILFSQNRGWVAIDPKGVVGEPCFEVHAFLRNPASLFADAVKARATCARRLQIFSQELGFAKERITRWAVAQAVLSACWCLEEESPGGWQRDMVCAETYASLLQS